MRRYRIEESIGSRRERVRSYDDLEIHHPSHRGREPGRVYADVDGEREEVLRRRTDGRQLLVSKDFILLDDASNSRTVPVPAPASGFIGHVDQRNGLVTIIDRPGGELIAQVRHMDLRGSTLRAGDRIAYGDAMGIQSGFGKGRPDAYGVHVHIDFNVAHLDQLKRYVADLDSGQLQIPVARKTIEPQRKAVSGRPEAGATAASVSSVSGLELQQTRDIQRMLRDLGYRSASGGGLAVDGIAGPDTEHALRSFAIDVNLGSATRGPAIATKLRETHAIHRRHSDVTPAPLQSGDRGASIAELQRALNRLSPALLSEDGEFGARTRSAVEAFQRAQGLDVDGRVGPRTAEALEREQRLLPSHASHPAHAWFGEALEAVHAMEQRECRPSGGHSERLAAALAAAALEHGLGRIDRVELNDRGTLARAIQVSAARDESTLNRMTPTIGIEDALRVPLRDAGSRLAEAVHGADLQASTPRLSVEAPERRPVMVP